MAARRFPAYRSPTLSLVYRVAGGCAVALGIMVGLSAMATAGKDSGAAFAVAGLMFAGAAIGTAVIFFGIAELFAYFAKTAYNTALTVNLLVEIADGMRQQPAAHSAVATPDADAPKLTGLAESANLSCPSCMAELDVKSVRRGTNRCPACGVSFIAE